MKRYIRLAILMGMLGATLAAPLRAESAPSNEYKIKAALIYNILKFIDWPDETGADRENLNLSQDSPRAKELVMGVLADDEIFRTCLSLQDKTVKNRKIRLVRLRERDFRDEDLKVLKGMDVLYLSRRSGLRKKVDLRKLLDALKGCSTLTFGEDKGFLEMGGIINFLKEENHICFEINLDAAKRVRLQIKTSVLKLAKRVLQNQQ